MQNELGGEHLRFECASRAAAARAVNKATGEPKKLTFGPWIFPVFKLLAQVQVPARHGVRSVRLFARAPDRAGAYRATMRRCSRRCWRSSIPATTTSRLGSPRSRRKSAASAMSSCAISQAAKADEAALFEQFRAGPRAAAASAAE